MARQIDQIISLVRQILESVLRKLNARDVAFGWRIGQAVNKQARKNPMIEKTITNLQKITFMVNPRTRPTAAHPEGEPAELDGDATCAILSGPATFNALPGGRSFDFVSQDNVNPDPSQNVTDFQVSGDADLGGGTETITDTVRLTVVHENAAQLGLAGGDPVDK